MRECSSAYNWIDSQSDYFLCEGQSRQESYWCEASVSCWLQEEVIALTEVGDRGRWALNGWQIFCWPADVDHCSDVRA